MNKSTRDYIENHEKVFSLEKKVLTASKSKDVYGWNMSSVLKYNFKSILKALVKYPLEVFQARLYLKKTSTLKNNSQYRRALVIGNGPSQNFLTVQQLNEFKSLGGETICVNYWQDNDFLAKHIPSWMIFSDPATFDLHSAKAQNLVDYIIQNPSVKLSVPASLLSTLNVLNIKNDTYCFIDTELSIWKNIHPLFPRGYISMTLYKALAWAVYLGFSEIGIIGMDNTYPRNLYNDRNNHVCNLETHSGETDYLVDNSALYPSVSARLYELSRLFHNLKYFPKEKIYNLDLYSLTDEYKKIEIDDYIY